MPSALGRRICCKGNIVQCTHECDQQCVSQCCDCPEDPLLLPSIAQALQLSANMELALQAIGVHCTGMGPATSSLLSIASSVAL